MKQNKEGYINVPGGKVWYKITGKKNKLPFIILHGGPGFPHNYLEPLEDLGDERELIFYDQLGCGKSERPNNDNLWKLDRFAEELENVIKFLNLKKYHLLGQSWGTALAVAFASKKPKGLISLILSDPYLSTTIWMKDVEKLKKLLPLEIQKIMKKHEKEGTTKSKEYKHASRIYIKNFVSRLKSYPASYRASKKGMNDFIYNVMWGPEECLATGNLKELDLTKKLKHITVPVLFLCGRYDEATPQSTEYFKNLTPNSQMKVFEKSAHFPFFNERGEYIKTVRNFLQKVE